MGISSLGVTVVGYNKCDGIIDRIVFIVSSNFLPYLIILGSQTPIPHDRHQHLNLKEEKD